jgi:hypothetical protein
MDVRTPAPGPVKQFPLVTALLLSAALLGCSLACRPRANLHSEAFQIARSLTTGKGFANPFSDPTGPTAWTAPVYPTVQAVLLWVGHGSRDVVMAGLVVLHVGVLLATGLLVLTLAWQTTRRVPAIGIAALFFLGLCYHFWYWFQLVHDCWMVMLALNLLIAGVCWCRPLACWPRAAGWGLVGGLCTLASPVLGLAWGSFTLASLRQGTWVRPAVALLTAALTLAPWAIRNYQVFGRLIPVKSNLAYELYQSQCLQADGLYQAATAPRHPSGAGSRERQEYRTLGESAYLDRKRQQFLEAVWRNPADFLDRVADRFLGATVWYVPFNRTEEARQPWALWARRLTHPLPFLALVFLLATAMGKRLHPAQWWLVAVYLLYLLPYIGLSYYERYAVPLDGIKVLLVLWAADRLFSLCSNDKLCGPG